ncbi:uncharacterized protein LOC122016662 isoform X1 [Zingiber officinale]|uniref:uncharacterized protein LOC122016662 isoform X1 n=1 Tax=Zingiber officinale TaxID=94328 RepID=UPI001C4C4CFE|nr:uncharacterized protein LOC122016662 isoform X1 [Zingiber officinale]
MCALVKSSTTMEDSAAILRHISSFKDMLDLVNEEIEHTILRTREVDTEIAKLSEDQDNYAIREHGLAMKITSRSLELEALVQVATISKASVELMEKEIESLKQNKVNIEKRISNKREVFLFQCKKFQEEMTTSENDVLRLLLLEKEALENEKENLQKKITALENSTNEFIEEILQEIHMCNSALEAEVNNLKSEHMIVLNDISDLRTLLESITSFEDSIQ